MELTDALYENYSKAGMEHIATQVTKGAWPFEALWHIIKTGEPPLPQRAAWAMDHTLERRPELLHTILDDAIFKHPGFAVTALKIQVGVINSAGMKRCQ